MVAFDTSWYRRVLLDRVSKTVKRREWEAAYEDIRAFEAQLAADGTVLIKFWFHISKKEQSRRFKKLQKNKLTAWQVADEDKAQHKAYDKYLPVVEDMLARTDAPFAPWTIVEATDRYYTRTKALETVIRALEIRLAGRSEAEPSQINQEVAHA
jgi:polyphosphate kinase 2 (PPK2 family)